MIRGRCDDCDRTYKGLPSADRTYTCKQCGGVVRAIEEGTEPSESASAGVGGAPNALRCPTCDARLPSSAKYCDACGAHVGADDDSSASTRRKAPAEREKVLIAKRAYGAMKTVRAIYWINVAFAALWVALWTLVLVVLSGVDEDLVAESTEIDSEELVVGVKVLLGIFVLRFGVFLTGAFLVVRRPFFWAVLMASAQTIWILIKLAIGFLGVLDLIVELVLFFALWGALKPVARLQRSLRDNPELWDRQVESARERSSHRKGVRRAVRDKKRRGELAQSEAMGNARDRARQRRRESMRKTLLFGGGTVGVIGAVALVAFLITRPPSFEDSTTAFFRAWNNADTETMAAYYPKDKQDRYAAFVRKFNRDRGHEGVMPKVFDTLVEYRGNTRARIVFYDSEEVPYIVVRWKRGDGGRWYVSGLTPP